MSFDVHHQRHACWLGELRSKFESAFELLRKMSGEIGVSNQFKNDTTSKEHGYSINKQFFWLYSKCQVVNVLPILWYFMVAHYLGFWTSFKSNFVPGSGRILLTASGNKTFKTNCQSTRIYRVQLSMLHRSIPCTYLSFSDRQLEMRAINRTIFTPTRKKG